MTISDDEWDRRVLCSDGNCIGIVGGDGRCKTCGRPYEGELPLPADDSETIDDDPAGGPVDGDARAEASNEPADETIENDSGPFKDDWDNRTLCIDESCIGVVGPDGRCKECGKPYPG